MLPPKAKACSMLLHPNSRCDYFGFRTHRILFAMHVGVDTMTSFKS